MGKFNKDAKEESPIKATKKETVDPKDEGGKAKEAKNTLVPSFSYASVFPQTAGTPSKTVPAGRTSSKPLIIEEDTVGEAGSEAADEADLAQLEKRQKDLALTISRRKEEMAKKAEMARLEATRKEASRIAEEAKKADVAKKASVGSPGKRGTKRMLGRDVDLVAAQVVIDRLLEEHPPKSHDAVCVEYEAFMAAHPDLANPLSVFIAGGKVNGMMWSSALGNFNILRKLYPAASIHERRLRAQFEHSLSAKRCLETGALPTDVELEVLLAYVQVTPPIEKRAFLWLLLITGGRPSCIYFVPLGVWRFLAEHLRVEWRLRKAGARRDDRHGATYRFAWSHAPTDDVVEYLLNSVEQSWKFLCPSPSNIASLVNAWLRRAHDVLVASDEIQLELPEKAITSSAFRDRMDAVLRAAQVDEATMKSLMDHSLKMSEAHYAVPE